MTPRMVCCRCGSAIQPERAVGGSFGLEVLLWCGGLAGGLMGLAGFWPALALVPVPVIYGLWRMSTARQVCPHCGCSELVPTTSPRGMAILEGRLHG